jgi:hypothetical protein
LQGPLTAKRLVVRELRLEQDQLQLALAAASGGQANVDDAVAALEQAQLGDVSFVEASTNGPVKLSVKLNRRAMTSAAGV